MKILNKIVDTFASLVRESEVLVKSSIKNVQADIEKRIEMIVKKFTYALFEILFMFTSLIFIILGLVLFFRRFFSLDLILLVVGLILFYVALLLKWKK